MQTNKTLKSIAHIFLGTIFLTLTSCATVGREFPVGPVAAIKVGETTLEEIQHMFGQPWRIGIEDGQKTWTYDNYRYATFGPNQTRDLVVRFDEQGKRGSHLTHSALLTKRIRVSEKHGRFSKINSVNEGKEIGRSWLLPIFLNSFQPPAVT
jgi:hypothetical protein